MLIGTSMYPHVYACDVFDFASKSTHPFLLVDWWRSWYEANWMADKIKELKLVYKENCF